MNKDLLVTIGASVVALGIPGLIWGGGIDARVASAEKNQEQVEKSQERLRREIREDLREINRKLDDLKK